MIDRAAVLARNNVRVSGGGKTSLIFAHGFGCDQNMWRFVAPAFADRFRIVLFDHVGAGGSDLGAYDRAKYSTLSGYADDLVDVVAATESEGAVFVGHSVSAMIGVLASIARPDAFSKLVLVGPSARYIDDGEYVGGFSSAQVEEMLDFLDANHMGWSETMAPVIMGNADRPDLGKELTNSFCRTDPGIAKQFARVTFLSDNRADLSRVSIPTLILQCTEDVIAPREVGEFVHRNIDGSRLMLLSASGHCPNLSAPGETIDAIAAFV